jgi:Ca-activated chloride channel family protein
VEAQQTAPAGSGFTLRSEVDLLSVAVRVTDRNDNEVHGLAANQFSLYEDGTPQKISFFEAEEQPVSLGVLLDVSGSMGGSGKLAQAKEALSRVISSMRPADEIFYVRFHSEIVKEVDFTNDSHRVLSAISATTATENSTNLYDAIARGLCYMLKARNHRQALIVVTDGTDQSSHRTLEDLTPIVQASQAQVFIIGFLEKQEYDSFRKSRNPKTMLLTHKEVDNPIRAFNQLAANSGAESFFPNSPASFQRAVEVVARQLQTQYTLAYYPQSRGPGFHNIEVKVAQPGLQVRARRGFAIVPGQPGACEDEKLKPYPFESKVAVKNGCTIYHEDFQDTASGWPNKKRYQYKSGSYQIVNAKAAQDPDYGFDFDHSSWGAANNVKNQQPTESIPLEGLLVGNGPLLTGDGDVSVDVDWKSGGAGADMATVPGLVFRLNNIGYYAVLVSRDVPQCHGVAIKLVKKYHSEPEPRDLIPWREIPLTQRTHAGRLSVQCRGPAISILFNGTPEARFEDPEFKEGTVGMIVYGLGRAEFRELLAEEVRTSTPPPAVTATLDLHGSNLEKPKPSPYDSKVSVKNGCKIYHEDFQNAASGWPTDARRRYKSGTYQIVSAERPTEADYDLKYSVGPSYGKLVDVVPSGRNAESTGITGSGVGREGLLAANGPWFSDLNASVTVEWISGGPRGDLTTAPGLAFHISNRGFYAVLLSKNAPELHGFAFKLVKLVNDRSKLAESELIPWKTAPFSEHARQEKISVQCRGPVITILIQDITVAKFEDSDFKDGQVGMALYGSGSATFTDLVAEDACSP